MVQDLRTPEQIRHHYDIEIKLAEQLRRAGRDERRALYGRVYDELYSKVTDIPHMTAAVGPGRAEEVDRQLRFLSRFLTPTSRYLELGPGDCRISIAVAQRVAQVHAVDVTATLVDPSTFPANMAFHVASGLTIPLPSGSVDVAFTDQVLEHLHPEDADEHLREVRRVLAPGGVYVCVTPNRLYGPHDVSKYFDDVACGLHLKEYSVTELMRAFQNAGYSRTAPYTLTSRVDCLRVPRALVQGVEATLDQLPKRLRVGFACTQALLWLLRSRVVGWK